MTRRIFFSSLALLPVVRFFKPRELTLEEMYARGSVELRRDKKLWAEMTARRIAQAEEYCVEAFTNARYVIDGKDAGPVFQSKEAKDGVRRFIREDVLPEIERLDREENYKSYLESRAAEIRKSIGYAIDSWA